MLKDRKFEIGNLIRLTSAGMEAAEFVDIRDAIVKRYKDAYGSDIDLSTANADGVFVNDMALIINNILQVMKSLYGNLDVDTANGVYLDALCKLANVNRLPATKSVASLTVTSNYTTGGAVTFGDVDGNGNVLNQITFIDKAGTEWVSNTNITLEPGKSAEISATCTETGPVNAPAGWITNTLLTMNLTVAQPSPAIQGSDIESDADLRQRRAQSSGANGIGILESLVGALLEVAGIDDVYIYNNNTLENKTAKDGTVIAPHNIYVILRQQDGLEIADETIGNLIYTKLTPGIKTTASNANETNGVAKQYEFIPQMLGVTINYLNQLVYWKKAVPVKPKITITLSTSPYFAESEFEIIAKSVYNYTNNIKLGKLITADEVFIAAYDADPKFKGQRTYFMNASGIVIEGAENLTNPDTYYNYSTFSFTKQSAGVYTLTIQ